MTGPDGGSPDRPDDTDGGTERPPEGGPECVPDGEPRQVPDGGTDRESAGTAPGTGAIDLAYDLPEPGRRRLPRTSRRTLVFLVAVAGVVAGFAYDYAVLGPREGVVFGWDPAVHEWLFVLSLVVFCFYVLVPLAANPRLTRTYWRRLRNRPVGLASFLYLVAFFVVGMVGPVLVGPMSLTNFNPPYQPPVGLEAPKVFVTTCAGEVSGGQCHGSLQYPLGTDGIGRDVVTVVVHGVRIALEVALVSAMLVVPLATAVGTVAAEFGGRVDDVLMRAVDLTQVVPAFFVYIVAQYVYRPRLSMLLVVFGLLSWGSIARVVRSEAIGTREADYVRAARCAGAGRLSVVRRHVVPNVTNTVVASVTLLIPTLIIIEAALSYLALGDPTANSLGYAISAGLNTTEFPTYWWISTVPALVLVVTVVALNLFGDALRDVLDPRMDR